jgi:hypothetical protein
VADEKALLHAFSSVKEVRMTDWKSWRRHFEDNAERPRPVIGTGEGVPDEAREAVAASMARFQLGETGEGRIAHEIDRVHLRTIDDDYRQALKLFVAEEGRHARILGDAVRALGGCRIEKSASHSAFTRGRRLLGIRTKLLALLAAEVVGIGFYETIASSLGDGPLRRALTQVAGDEEAHLRFHARFFRQETRAGGTLGRAAFRASWWPLILGATSALVRIERGTLDSLGIAPHALARTYLRLAARVDAAVLGSLEPEDDRREHPVDAIGEERVVGGDVHVLRRGDRRDHLHHGAAWVGGHAL